MQSLPIACTLGSGQGPERMARWAAVNEHAVSREHRAGVIEVRYDGTVEQQLAQLVAAERECCGHLGWEIVEAADGVTLRVRGSEDDLDAFEA